jgi:hypothetical protein
MITLALGDIVQSSDSKILRVSDGTTDWGVGANPSISEITSLTPYTLQFTITTSDGVETIYDSIDLVSNFGPFTDQTDLVFDITANMLISDSTALGTSDDTLPDGWYSITYSFTDGTTVTTVTQVFVDGVIRNKIYNEVVTIPDSHVIALYTNSFNDWNNVLIPIYQYSKFIGMESEISLARKSDVLGILKSLQQELL